MPGDGRILLIEHHEELGRLYRITLEEEGFAVDLVIDPPDVVKIVREREPALLILDLLPPNEQSYALLDRLRTDDVARGVPVLTLTTQGHLAETSLASYNVRRSFAKPFDIDALVEAVREASRTPTLQGRAPRPRPESDDARDHAEHILAERSRQIVFRWMQRIRTLPPWRDRPDLSFQDLIDYAPVVLKLIDVRLHYTSHDEFFQRHPDALERARGHARIRQSQNIGAVSAIEEYVLLREEIWAELRAESHEEGVRRGMFEVERAINYTLDVIIVATLRAYLEQIAST